MAEFWSNNDRGYRLRVWLDTTSQDVEANTSQVRVRAHLLNDGWTFTGYQITARVTVDGQVISYSGSPAMLSNKSTIQLIDKTITVNHNDDGTKTANMTANLQGGGGYSPNALGIGQQGYKLADIARASSATVPSGVIGLPMTITIQPVKAGYTHTVRYEFGNKTGVVASNVATSTNWTPLMDLCDLFPNSQTGTGQIHVDTYSGGRKLGTRSFSTNLTIPDSVKPTLSNFSLLEGSDVVKRKLPDGPFVQILSQIKVNFGVAQGVRGSTIKGYKAVVLGSNQTVTENNGSFGVIDRSGEVTIRATVIDSRGRESAPVDKKIRIEAYHAPVLSFGVRRSGALQDILLVNRNAKVASLGNKNRMKLRFFAARGISTNYTAANGAAAGEWTSTFEFVNSEAQITGSYSGTSSWTIKGVLEDSFTSTEFVYQVPPEQVVLSYTPDGVGIKKPWERGAVDVKGDVYIDGNIIVNNKQIQQYQLTSNVGGGLPNNFSHVDDIKTPGVWQVPADKPGNPLGAFSILECFKLHNSNECIQRITTTSGFMAVREFGYDNVWRPWRYVAQTSSIPTKNADHRNLRNTGWVDLQEGVSVKRIGDIVTIKLVEIKLTKGTDMSFTKLPEDCRPPSSLMETVSTWAINNEFTKLQIENDGTWFFLGGTIRRDALVTAQITFTV